MLHVVFSTLKSLAYGRQPAGGEYDEAFIRDFGLATEAVAALRNIRQKLRKVTKKEYIQTVWGVGYKFVDVPGE